MAIRVKHGDGDIGALVQLAALAGAAQARAPQIPQIRPTGLPSGGGGGGRGGFRRGGTLTLADYGRIRYPTAGEQMAEEKTRQMEYEKKRLLQEEAQKAAIPIDYKYTQRQRAEIAQLQNAKQDLMRNPRFSDTERQLLARQIDAQIDTIQPIGIPRDPSKPRRPDGRNPGDSWKDEFGNIRTIEPDGKEVVQIGYKETREGLAAAHDRAMELEKVKQEMAFAKEMRATKAKLSLELVSKLSPEGQDEGSKRHRTSAEIEEAMFRIYGPSRQRVTEELPSDIELEQELQRRIAGRGPEATGAQEPWWIGTKATDAEKQLPPRPGRASMYIREAIKEYKGIKNMPPEVQAAFRQASQILIQHYQKFTGQ